MLAARSCSTSVIRVLINGGADLNLRNKEERTAFSVAKKASCIEASEMPKAAGATE
jgi:ankyrin repeat protein